MSKDFYDYIFGAPKLLWSLSTPASSLMNWLRIFIRRKSSSVSFHIFHISSAVNDTFFRDFGVSFGSVWGGMIFSRTSSFFDTSHGKMLVGVLVVLYETSPDHTVCAPWQSLWSSDHFTLNNRSITVVREFDGRSKAIFPSASKLRIRSTSSAQRALSSFW